MAGRDMADRPLSGAPRFFPGAAVAPEAEPFELMFQKFTKKVHAGARFFQTQAVFDAGKLEAFMAAARPLRDAGRCSAYCCSKARSMARFLNATIPGVRVPERLIKRLEKAMNPLEEGVAIAREMVGASTGSVPGGSPDDLGTRRTDPGYSWH